MAIMLAFENTGINELTPNLAESLAYSIFKSAATVLKIHGIGGKRWRRNVPSTDSRYGPWLQANYSVVNSTLWGAREPCMYLVAGQRDGIIRYVGISRNRMRDRWRESPALDHETGAKIENQLFHSQCWKYIESELINKHVTEYEVRCIGGQELRKVLENLGPPLSAFAALGDDYEGIAASIERWMCNNRSHRLVSWNVAMTARK